MGEVGTDPGSDNKAPEKPRSCLVWRGDSKGVVVPWLSTSSSEAEKLRSETGEVGN